MSKYSTALFDVWLIIKGDDFEAVHNIKVQCPSCGTVVCDEVLNEHFLSGDPLEFSCFKCNVLVTVYFAELEGQIDKDEPVNSLSHVKRKVERYRELLLLSAQTRLLFRMEFKISV
jgi:hypothetical protein